MPSSQQRSSNECDGAVIVGGGIAGLAVAAALQNITHINHVAILEQSSPRDFEDELQGAALILGPNALRALKAIGGQACLDQVLDQGSHIKGNATIPTNATSTDRLDEYTIVDDKTLGTTGLPQVLIRWGVLRRILQNLLNDDTVQVSNNAHATNFRTTDNGRMQVLNSENEVMTLPNNNGNSDNTTPLLIAADGIHSHFGKRLHPNDNLKDNGRVNVKAVVKRRLFNHINGITYSHFEGNIACFAGPAGDEYTYWAISLPNDKAQSPSEVLVKDLNALKDDLLQQLSAIHVPSFIVELSQATPASRIFVRQSQESRHVLQLYSSSCNIVLVGDAAHVMSPSYGQSASMALEDAVTLAACIKNHPLKTALEKYSQARTSRSEKMVKQSARRTKLAVKGEPIEDVSQWIFQWEPPT